MNFGRWFNVDLQTIKQSIAHCCYVGTFTSESFDQGMELLTLTTQITYSTSKREVLTIKLTRNRK
jgi:hypothetical protein